MVSDTPPRARAPMGLETETNSHRAVMAIDRPCTWRAEGTRRS